MAAPSPSHPHRPDSRAAKALRPTTEGTSHSRSKSALALARNLLGQSGKAASTGKDSATSERPHEALASPRGQPTVRASPLRPTTPTETLATEQAPDTRRSGRYSSLFRRASGRSLAISPESSTSSSSLPLTQTPPLEGQTHGTQIRKRRSSFSHLTRGRSLSRTDDEEWVVMADVPDKSVARTPPPAARRIYRSEDVEHYIRQGVRPQSDVRSIEENPPSSATLAPSNQEESRIAPPASCNIGQTHRRTNSLSSVSLLGTDGFSVRRGFFERKRQSNKDKYGQAVSKSGDAAPPTPSSSMAAKGFRGPDRPSSSQSFSPLSRPSSRLRLTETSSAMTTSIKSAGKKGWTVVRGVTPSMTASQSATSLTPFVERIMPNYATQRWLQLEDVNAPEPSARQGLIFGASLATAVLQTRLVSPGVEPHQPLSVQDSSDGSEQQDLKTRSESAEYSPTTLGTLDFGAEFTFPSSFLSVGTDESSGLQPDEAVVAPASTAPSASPHSPLRDSGPLDRQSARLHMLPRFVTRCIESLETFGLQEEGIYRLSGRSSHTARLRALFDGTCEPPWAPESSFAYDLDLKLVSPVDCDINSVCSILKAYLRELPHPLLTRTQLAKLEASLSGNVFALDQARDSLQESGLHEWYLLREIALHLMQISSNEHVAKTRMTLSNICLVLAPTLSIPVHLLRSIVQQHDALFAYAPCTQWKSLGQSPTPHSQDIRRAGSLITSTETNRQSNASSILTIVPHLEQAVPSCFRDYSSGQPASPKAAPALTWLSERRDGSEASEHQRHHTASTSLASLSLCYTGTASTQHSCSSSVNPDLPDYGTSSDAASSLNTLASTASEEETSDARPPLSGCSTPPSLGLLDDDMHPQMSPYRARSRAGSPTVPTFTLSSCPAPSARGDKHAAPSTLIPRHSVSSLRSSGPPSQYVTPTSSPHISESSMW